MKLCLLRHGEAVPHATRDALRELTERGCHQVRNSATALISTPLELILASPYVRAQQTAALVTQVLGWEQGVQTVPWLTPETSPTQVLEHLASYPQQNILLVAHQPLLGDLAGLLIHGHRQDPEPMVTGQLIRLEGEFLIPGLMSARN